MRVQLTYSEKEDGGGGRRGFGPWGNLDVIGGGGVGMSGRGAKSRILDGRPSETRTPGLKGPIAFKKKEQGGEITASKWLFSDGFALSSVQTS